MTAYAYKNDCRSHLARFPSIGYALDKSNTSLGHFSTSSEANAMQENNDKINNCYSANQVYENSESGYYPNMKTFLVSSHVSPQLSNFSPQNCSPKPQQKQSDIKKQETVVKTENLKNQLNRIIDSNSDCNSVIDIPIHNCNFQQFSKHINDTMGSQSGSFGVSEISRPCSVSNHSVSSYNNESPLKDPTYSPLSYQQNRNHIYGNQPQTAPQVRHFSHFSHNNPQEAHNSQANLHENFEYNQ